MAGKAQGNVPEQGLRKQVKEVLIKVLLVAADYRSPEAQRPESAPILEQVMARGTVTFSHPLGKQFTSDLEVEWQYQVEHVDGGIDESGNEYHSHYQDDFSLVSEPAWTAAGFEVDDHITLKAYDTAESLLQGAIVGLLGLTKFYESPCEILVHMDPRFVELDGGGDSLGLYESELHLIDDYYYVWALREPFSVLQALGSKVVPPRGDESGH